MTWNEIRDAASTACRIYHASMFRARPLDVRTTVMMDKRSRPLMYALRDLQEVLASDDCDELRPVAARMAERALAHAQDLLEYSKGCP